MYNQDNIFSKIIKGEVSCKKIYEDEYVFCFEDIAKAAPIHWLVVPKLPVTDITDFLENANNEIKLNFFSSIYKIIKKFDLDKSGFKLITNNGSAAGQSVFHFHVHIISGSKKINSQDL
jgi:histidine triad (HIT) family protein